MSQLALIGDDREGWTNDDWATPWEFVRSLEVEFGTFDLDPCCTPETAKAARYFTRADDGLNQDWTGLVFCNPPYSRRAAWLEKAHTASLAGATVVCLIPAEVSEPWFHRTVVGKAEIRLIKRFTFLPIGRNGKPTKPRTGCVLAIFRPEVSHSGE